jgi:hypothetical protein
MASIRPFNRRPRLAPVLKSPSFFASATLRAVMPRALRRQPYRRSLNRQVSTD